MNEKEILNNLMKVEDILVCMLIAGNATIHPDMQPKIRIDIWYTLQYTLDGFKRFLKQAYHFGCERVTFEVSEHLIFVYLVAEDAAIVAIAPALCNRGLVEIKLESARLELKKILK